MNLQHLAMGRDDCAGVGLCCLVARRVVCDDGAQLFLGIQTVISGKTRFFRPVWGVILGLMRLKCLSVKDALVEYLKTL